MKLRRIFGFLSLTRAELVVVAILVVVMELFLNLWVLRTEYTSDPNVFIAYWGFPLEALRVRNVVSHGIYPDVGMVIHIARFFEVLWLGIAVNLVIYVMLSIFFVKGVIWVRDEVEDRRYGKNV